MPGCATSEADVTVQTEDGGTSPKSDPGLLVGRYEIGDLMGRGGGGQVHTALDRLTGEQVAVKFVRMGAQSSAEVRRELTALRMLDLPGLARLRDDGTSDGQLFFVMDLLPNGRIDRLAGPWSSVGPLVTMVVEALGRLHQVGVLHRDLKPGNILLDVNNQPVITDFGLAQGFAVEDPKKTRLEGTPRYMPPEQRAGEVSDERTDLYALGAVIWELLCGERFPEDPQTRTTRLQAVDELPHQVVQSVLAMISPARDQRPASAEEVLRALGTWTDFALPELPRDPSIAELVALFDEVQPSYRHLAEDGANLLLERALQRQCPVSTVLQEWLRTPHARVAGDRIHVDRVGLEALRWQGSGEALALSELGRQGNASALIRRGLELAKAMQDAGNLVRSFAVLESLSTLDDEVGGAVLRELVSVGLALGDDAAAGRAMYRAERAGAPVLVQLIHGARLCRRGELNRGIDVLTVLNTLPESLEPWRLGFLALALGRRDPETATDWLAEIRPGPEAAPIGHARWLDWAGKVAYSGGDYAQALAYHEQSLAFLGTHPRQRITFLINATIAAAETVHQDRALRFAEEARALARLMRQPTSEARASIWRRWARYRLSEALIVDVARVDAAAELGRFLEANAALLESAIAWRQGDSSLDTLALRAAAAFSEVGFPGGVTLSLALAVCGGASGQMEALSRSFAETREPSLSLQAAALIGDTFPEAVPAELSSWLAQWHLPDADLRADVLSLAECRARLGV